MIAIPNMEKPKSCYNHCLEDFIANKEIGCPLKDYIESHQYKSKIHPDCPLIEIDGQIFETAIKLAKLNRTMAEVEANEDKYIPNMEKPKICVDGCEYEYAMLPNPYIGERRTDE